MIKASFQSLPLQIPFRLLLPSNTILSLPSPFLTIMLIHHIVLPHCRAFHRKNCRSKSLMPYPSHMSLSQVSWITSVPLKFHIMLRSPAWSLPFWLSKQDFPPSPTQLLTDFDHPNSVSWAYNTRALHYVILSSPAAFTLLRPCIFLSLVLLLKIRDQILHPYKTGKTVQWYLG
jgi:hypothetical protein